MNSAQTSKLQSVIENAFAELPKEALHEIVMDSLIQLREQRQDSLIAA